MKKTKIILQTIILLLFFILLSKYLWTEEVLLLFLLPTILVFIISGVFFLIIRIFRKINFRKSFIISLVISSILQVLLCLYIIWSVYPREYNKEKVSKDINHSIALMEDIHPDLYAVIDKDRFTTISDSIKNTLPAIITDSELYKIFGFITAQIKDGHTGFAIDNFIKRGSVLFKKVPPYKFKIFNGRIYLLKNYYIRDNIPIGSEILTINNKPASQCLNEICRLFGYETKSFRDAWLQLPIIWGMWNNFQEFTISYKTPDNSIETVTTASGLFANLSYLWDITAGFGMQNYNFDILNGNIGYINLRAFNDLDNFKIFLNSTFTRIKLNEINNLIVDIRENGGGATSVSEELMQYISPVAYTTFDSSWIKISDHLLKQYSLDTTKYIPGSLHLENSELKDLNENPVRFKGHCYILTSGYCFSTALDFPAMARYFNAAKIIGSETGGRTKSFGSPATVSLPETEIILKVSRKKFINVGAIESNRGLIPDYIVENSIEDDINGVDSVLDSAIALIRFNQQ